jgi:hypothetical protein
MGLMTSAETFTAHLHYAQGDCTTLPSITKRDWESGRLFTGAEPRTFFVHFKRKVGGKAWSKAPRAINATRVPEKAAGSGGRGGERRTERQQDSTAGAEAQPGGRDPGREKKTANQRDATIILPKEPTGSYYRPRYEVPQSLISRPLPKLTVQKYPMTTRGHVRPPRLIKYNEPEELVSVARYTSQGVYRDEVMVPRSMLPVDDPRAGVSGRDEEVRERERMEAVEMETQEREKDKQQKEREKQERIVARETRRRRAQEEEEAKRAAVRKRVNRDKDDLPLFVRSTSPVDEPQRRDESLPLFVRSTSPLSNPQNNYTSNPSFHIPSTPLPKTSYNDRSRVSFGRRNALTRSPQRDTDFSFTATPVFPPASPPLHTPLTSVFQPPTVRPMEEIQSDVERLRRLLDTAHEEERGNQERWARQRQRGDEMGGGVDEESVGEEEELEGGDGEWRWSEGFEMMKSVGGKGKGKK